MSERKIHTAIFKKRPKHARRNPEPSVEHEAEDPPQPIRASKHHSERERKKMIEWATRPYAMKKVKAVYK